MVTLLLLMVIIYVGLNAEFKVDQMVKERYREIIKPMLSIGDIVAINMSMDNSEYVVGIVTSITSDGISYIGQDGRKSWVGLSQISKIYCNDEMAKKVKAKAVKNFEETLENAIINSK